ncbi:hypothetical protein ACFVKB_17455 [Rhodococcus sp. NPDC127530]|uniref:hypothetical protein n=1 Tax=unclassified Rhodococcus (in: high G+C Gram-positive bacteria) TaxID=192944 RepID=UPI003635F649
MARTPRNREADRSAIRAAAERLLAGAPLRSTSGKLTATELITESGLRRDIVYEHGDLVGDFKARLKARDGVPEAMQQLADRYAETQQALETTKKELVREREASAYLRRVVAELSIELAQVRQKDDAPSAVTQLQPRRSRQFFTRPG